MRASCSCGYTSLPLTLGSACLVLVLHLERAVREGAVLLSPVRDETRDGRPDDGWGAGA